MHLLFLFNRINHITLLLLYVYDNVIEELLGDYEVLYWDPSIYKEMYIVKDTPHVWLIDYCIIDWIEYIYFASWKLLSICNNFEFSLLVIFCIKNRKLDIDVRLMYQTFHDEFKNKSTGLWTC
jgi:hypothetical protein